MNNVGQKYVYYAPSQLENTDKLRTLLGLFWHHDAENNQMVKLQIRDCQNKNIHQL